MHFFTDFSQNSCGQILRHENTEDVLAKKEVISYIQRANAISIYFHCTIPHCQRAQT